MSRAEAGFQPGGRAPAPSPLDLVQDFVNTEVPVWSQDDVSTPEELDAWLRARGLLSEDAVVDADAFVRARALRSLLRRLARRNADGSAPPDELREEFAAVAAGAGLRAGLDELGNPTLEPGSDGVDGALARIVAVVVEAELSGSWRRLKSCPGAHCGWVFYDASRNASSTWCSMTICGNRSKTAAYRSRRRDS